MLIETLRKLNDMGVPGVSIYSLDKQRRTVNSSPQGPHRDESFHKNIEIFFKAKQYLEDNGFVQILQNIFAKPEKGSYRHQSHRWENSPLVALGVSSQGYAPKKPYRNIISTKSYYQSIDEGKLPLLTVDHLSDEMEMARELTSLLRFDKVPLGYMQKKYGIDIKEIYGDIINALITLELLSEQNDCLKLTRKAAIHSDIIVMLFAPDKFKEQLLGLPSEYLDNYPIPHAMVSLGRTQLQPIIIK